MLLYDRNITLLFEIKSFGSVSSTQIDFIGDILSKDTGFKVESNYDEMGRDKIEIVYTSPNWALCYDYDGSFCCEEVTCASFSSELLEDICAAFEKKYNTEFAYELDEFKDESYGIFVVKITFIETPT